MFAYELFRYIHANYRFVVDPRDDYRAQAIDADVHLEWGSVLQILVSAQSQSTNCPICLSTPVAPRMAKCGHIFCLPCLIRYMHSNEDTNPVPEKKARWRKCPICWDTVYVSETRPVRWFAGQEGEPPREGEDVVLRLMVRKPGSILALPRDGAESLDKPDDIPWFHAAEVMDYARVIKGSEEYMSAQYEEEIKKLEYQEREDELIFGEDTTWTRKAISGIREVREKLKGMGNPPVPPKQPSEKAKRKATKFPEPSEAMPEFYAIQHAMKSGQSFGGGSSGFYPVPEVISNANDGSIPSSNTKDDSNGIRIDEPIPNGTRNDPKITRHRASAGSSQPRVASSPSNQNPPAESPFYFYESLLHYYLSPLDIRILKAAFGDFGSFPTTVLPRVERVSTGHIVDDDLRRRAKYLAHLPRGCEVRFLECDWTDVVGSEILEVYSEEIERRRKRNREKEIREEKERMRAEKEEDDKRWAAIRRRRPAVDRELEDLDREFQPLPTIDNGHASSSMDVAAGSSPPWGSSSRAAQNGSAFASLASPSTSPAASRTVWGTAAIPPTAPPPAPLAAPNNDHHEPWENQDGWLQGWEQALMQEDKDTDDLVARLALGTIIEAGDHPSMMTPSSSVSAGGVGGGGGGGNKRRKNKKITLLTTTARRGA